MEQVKRLSSKPPNSIEAPPDRAVFSDLVSAFDTLGRVAKRLESHPLASGDLPERLRCVEDAVALKGELGRQCSRFEAYEGTVSELSTRLEAVYSEVTGELRRLGCSFSGISEGQDVVSTRIEALEKDYREFREIARSIKEDSHGLRNDFGSLVGRVAVCEGKVTKLGASVAQVKEELSKGRRDIKEVTEFLSCLQAFLGIGAFLFFLLLIATRSPPQ